MTETFDTDTDEFPDVAHPTAVPARQPNATTPVQTDADAGDIPELSDYLGSEGRP